MVKGGTILWLGLGSNLPGTMAFAWDPWEGGKNICASAGCVLIVESYQWIGEGKAPLPPASPFPSRLPPARVQPGK